ncbi:MAG: two-component regulator propeller domain-containing protein [Cytophagales bacterium]
MKVKLVGYSLLIVLIYNCFISKSQNPFNFRQYNSQNGLYATKIKQISQDSLGLLWLATNTGLLKYDGFEFTNFENLKNLPELYNSDIINLFTDDKRNIWIGCNNALIVYDNKTGLFEKISFPENFKPYVNSITQDAQGVIWVATNNGIFIINNKKVDKILHYLDRIDHVIFLKKSKKLLIVSYNNIFQLNNQSHAITSQIKYCNDSIYTDNIQTCVQEDHYGNLWVGKYNGDVYKYAPQSATINKFDLKQITNNQSAVVNNIYSDKTGNLWFCIDESGIYSFNFKDNLFAEFITPKNSESEIASFKLTTIYKDREDNFWIASEKNGLILTNHKLNIFKNKNLNDISKTKIVSAILQDSNKDIWVGTDGDGIYIFNSDLRLIKKYRNDNTANQNSLPNNAVLSIFEDSKKRIWIGTFRGGLTLFNSQNGTFTSFQHDPDNPKSISKNDVRKIAEDSNGNLWLSVHGKGVSCFNTQTNEFTNYLNMSSTWTYDLLYDSESSIWVATNNGISRKRKNENRFSSYFTAATTDLKDNHFNCLLEDESGIIWLGTPHGLYFTDKSCKKISLLSQFSFLQKLSINSISCFQKNALIVSTNKGLVYLDLKHNKSQFFGVEDGLLTDEFIVNSKFVNTDKRTAMFGSSKGFTVFYPNLIQKITVNTKPVLVDIKVFNQSILSGTQHALLNQNINHLRQFEFTYQQNHIIFDLASPSYLLRSNNLSIQYKLEGLENDWQNLSNTKSVTYPSVPPGNYTFKTRYVLNGVPAELETNYKLVITPPFWQTWWFKLFVLVAFIVIVYLYFRIKTKRLSQANKILELKIKERTLEITQKSEILEQQKRELALANESKDKLFSIIAHDLRSPFGGIIALTDMLTQDYQNQTEQQRFEIITYIKKSTQSIYNTLENLLHWARTQRGNIKFNPQWFSLTEHLKHLKTVYDSVALEKDIDIQLNIKKPIQVCIDKNLFETIIRNLLNNAIKFSEFKSKICISTDVTDDGFVISIQDYGIGMTSQQIDTLLNSDNQTTTDGTSGEKGTGLGLLICKDFLKLHGATWQIFSNKNEGTCFVLNFPCATVLEKLSATDIDVSDVNANVTWIEPTEAILLKNKKILIVEDQISIRKALRLQLESVFTIIEADNGLKGLEIAKNEMPDLILSDVVMPEMNGLEFSNIIKNDIGTCHIPIIMLTSQDDEKNVILGLQTGVDDYLIKPYKLSILGLKVVKILINREKLLKKFKLDDKPYLENLSQNSSDNQFVKQLIQIIDDHISDEDFGVEQLSHKISMHRTNLSKKASELTGFSPIELIKIQRMKAAAILMTTSGKNVSEVAYAVGFSDPKYFSKVFKAYYGVLPSEYQ